MTKPVLLPKATYAGRHSAVDEVVDPHLYSAVDQASAGRPRFLLHDGPPYANGDAHLGTGLNKVLKDFVTRSQRMLGKHAPFVPGWDCHGLPVEWKVEENFRKSGVAKTAVTTRDFRTACKEYATHWMETQAAQFVRLGVLADWDHRYTTMQPTVEAGTVAELYRMLDKGLLYREKRPVYWSVAEQTALADAEVEHLLMPYTSLFVKFPVAKTTHEVLRGAAVVCWTTTPWSLPGNRAVACHPEGNYVAVRAHHQVFLVSKDVAEKVFEKLVEVLAEFKGSDLLGTVCRHPLFWCGFEHPVPVLNAEFADPTTGTGFVHVAPTLGPDDFRLALKENLPLDDVVGADGAYTDAVPVLHGVKVMKESGEWGEAESAVMAALRTGHMVLSERKDVHDAAVSWRSKSPLLYRATTQWFVAVHRFRDAAVEALADVNFVPPSSRTRLTTMVEGRPDWCVSRQRQWGVPLAFFVHKDTGEVLNDADVRNRVVAAFASEGSDAWFTHPPSFFLGERDPEQYVQVQDVLDVWFESGCTFGSVVENRFGTPVSDLYLEATDQHRGWFNSSLLASTATRGHAPYKAVFTHGWVMGSQSEKLSKSLSNAESLMGVVEKYSADAFRLWAAHSDVTNDMRFSDESMKAATEMLRKFRNTLRWLLGNLNGEFEPTIDFEDPERWMLARLGQMDKELRKDVEAFDFHSMTLRLRTFCVEDLSAFWFNMRKDVLYCEAADSMLRRSVLTVVQQVFDCLTRWLAPLVPFSADEAWRMRHPNSVHEVVWPQLSAEHHDELHLENWRAVRLVRDAVLKALEPEQASGRVKAVVDAAVTVELPDVPLFHYVASQDLAMVCGVSYVEVLFAKGVGVKECRPAAGVKCVRCWRTRFDVLEEDMCERCRAV